jgi:hypothetical protein
MGIVASLAASKVAQEVVEDEARRELVRILNIKTLISNYFSKIATQMN